MSIAPELAMDIARRYTNGIQRRYTSHQAHLDIEDIYGDILLRYVQYPPKNEHEMWVCAKFATHDWMRRQWGRRGQKSAAIQYAPAYWDTGDSEVEVLDTIPDPSTQLDDLVFSQLAIDALPFVFDDRKLQIITLVIDGWTNMEIGVLLGVTESRVSQILSSMRPKLARLLNLVNVEKVDDGGDRSRGAAPA